MAVFEKSINNPKIEFIMDKPVTFKRGRRAKVICPSCQDRHRTLSLYLWKGKFIHETVGRCERINSCNYNLAPSTWADREGKNLDDHVGVERDTSYTFHQERKVVVQEPSHIPMSWFESSLEPKRRPNKLKSYFWVDLFCEGSPANAVYDSFKVGSTLDGKAIFWQIAKTGQPRSGKIIDYENGKRVKSEFSALWVHDKMKKMLPNFVFQQVFFGIHRVNAGDSVIIVESEKTAILMECCMSIDHDTRTLLYDNVFFPGKGVAHDKVKWIATGAMNGIACELDYVCITKNDDLHDVNNIVLIPDITAEDMWQKAVGVLGKYFNKTAKLVRISPAWMEKYNLKKGDDIWDMYLEAQDILKFINKQKKGDDGLG